MRFTPVNIIPFLQRGTKAVNRAPKLFTQLGLSNASHKVARQLAGMINMGMRSGTKPYHVSRLKAQWKNLKPQMQNVELPQSEEELVLPWSCREQRFLILTWVELP